MIKQKTKKNRGRKHRPKVTSMFSSQKGKSIKTATKGKLSTGMFTSDERAEKVYTIAPHPTITSR